MATKKKVTKKTSVTPSKIDFRDEEDGPAHFLSSYDGNSYTTKSGFVYWRTN